LGLISAPKLRDWRHSASASDCDAQEEREGGGRGMRILLIEDEKEMAEALTAALGKHGIIIDHTMLLDDALELTRQHVYDAILLDRRLPDGEGLSLVPKLRRMGTETPIIVLTARNEPKERIKGLDVGADDYLGKPFLVEELMARLRAVLRRPANLAEPQINVGRMVVDPLHLNVTIGSIPLDLPRRELLVLVALAKRQGKTVLRSVLEAAVYNYEDEIQSNALDAHISRLRKRLLDAKAGVTVHNIRGVGYLLKED
jgi:DNA-binding response OmpR family regulator